MLVSALFSCLPVGAMSAYAKEIVVLVIFGQVGRLRISGPRCTFVLGRKSLELEKLWRIPPHRVSLVEC